MIKKSKKVYAGVGKRKTSIARVFVSDAAGENSSIVVNNRALDDYFKRPTSRMVVEQPFALTQTLGQYSVRVNVVGGGLSGQAGAIRHGITRALLEINPDFRTVLKSAGLITRDSRIKERKKYGLKAARRAPQFTKR
jgi:small subunit ribosomal protein S9